MNEIETIATGAAHDLSIWGLFMMADPVVKAVILLLLALSVWCWAIIFSKLAALRRARRRSDDFEEQFWSGMSLDTLYNRLQAAPPDPMSATFIAGMREWRGAVASHAEGGIRPAAQDRIDRMMSVMIARHLAQLEKSVTVLATTGSAAPFIGLFGTVWGIMNSFTSIAQAQNTNLAVVAPGIAEALFATALGLVAAIPASVAYNKFADDLARYAERLEGFAAEFSALLARHAESQLHAEAPARSSAQAAE